MDRNKIQRLGNFNLTKIKSQKMTTRKTIKKINKDNNKDNKQKIKRKIKFT
jgi:hypothetical protein